MKSANSNRYQIRAATLGDVEELVKMRLSLQQHMTDNNEDLWQLSKKKMVGLADFYRNQLKAENSRLIVVQDKESGSIVGMGLGRIFLHDDYIPDKSGRIDDVWIELHHRRKGLCLKIVVDLLQFFKSHNIEYLVLNYSRGNSEAESVWQQLGFKPVITTATAKLNDVETNLLKTQ